MSMLQESIIDKRKKIIEFCFEHKVLLTKDVADRLKSEKLVDELYTQIIDNNPPANVLKQLQLPLDKPTQTIKPRTAQEYPVKIVWDYEDYVSKRTMQDFVGYFNVRYQRLSKMLMQRQELTGATSIGRVNSAQEKNKAAIIGIVMDIHVTKNENIILTLEDPTGIIKAIISKSKQELYKQAKDIVFDEVIGLIGTHSGYDARGGVIFTNKIIHPDIPHKELKKSPDEAYAVFLACIHVGSSKFLHGAFEKFLKWIRGEYGTDAQKAMARKVGYVFVLGDTVDGIGIYPGQEKELEITDIYEQYAACAKLLSQIPQHIKIIVMPGNHDALRLSEPQPKLFKDYAKPLWEIPNVIMTGNPSVVNIHAKDGFPGFDILGYHGFSFDDYKEIVPSIRDAGKTHSELTPLIMKFYLQRRHLAPQHTSTLYIPDPRYDPLIIEHVPDIFAAGHIHKAAADSYKGVTILCSSTFQDKTNYQDRVGHIPDPGKVPVVNLQTRKIHMLKFGER